MKYYVGVFKNGGGRVFQTSKKVKKETFPFYKTVVGPFPGKVDAEDYLNKKIPGKKNRIKEKLPSGYMRMAKAKRYSKTSLIKRKNPSNVERYEDDLKSIRKEIKVVREAYRASSSPVRKAELRTRKDRLIILAKDYRVKIKKIKGERTRKNPSRAWHEKRLEDISKRDTSNLSDREQSVLMGKYLEELECLREEKRLKKNPLGATLMVVGNPAQRGKRGPKSGGDRYPSSRIKKSDEEKLRFYMKELRLAKRELKSTTTLSHKKVVKEAIIRYERKIIRYERKIKRLSEPKKNPARGSQEIYASIIAIEAVKGDGGVFPKEKFRHEFKRGSKVIGLENGDLLITNGKGKKLWQEFNY